MNKEELNKEITKLKQYIESHADQVKDLEHDLKIVTQRLEDYNKPKLTNKQFSKLHEVIENTLENFDFNNCNNYEPELEFIPVLLRTITENYNIPLLFDKKFIDYAIANSKLSEKDKLYFNNKRIHQLRIDYMNLDNIIYVDSKQHLLDIVNVH